MRHPIVLIAQLACALLACALLACESSRGTVSDGGRDAGRDRAPVTPDRSVEGGPPLTEALEVTATMTMSKPEYPCSSGLPFGFVLLPGKGGAVIGSVTQGWSGAGPQTAVASGTLVNGVLHLGAFRIRLAGPTPDDPRESRVDVEQLDARFDAATRTLEGTMTGVAHLPSAMAHDVTNDCPMTATLTGKPDTTPPLALFPTLDSPQSPLYQPELSFSEPVTLAKGAPLVTVTAGGLVLTVPFDPKEDPGGAVGYAKVPVPGHLPLGATVTLEVSADARDLAGSPLGELRSMTFKTVPDPGLLSNPGFEGGKTGFVTTSALDVSEQTLSYPAAEGTHFALWDAGPVGGALSFRLALPGTATKLRIAADYLRFTKSTTPGPTDSGLSLVVSTTTAKVTTSVQLPEPSLVLENALHTGWIDLVADVATLAGQEVVVTLHRKSAAPTSEQRELALDDIRVE